MQSILDSFFTAFSMYSIIPTKNVNFNKNTMSYALCFFPFVGIVIGVLSFIFYLFLIHFNFSPLLSGTLSCFLPIILTGKIHLDGLMDTSDAIGSFKPVEQKLEILKDPHIGAFGVIACVFYTVLNTVFFIEFYNGQRANFLIIAISYFLSRSYSAFSICTFKKAKNTGLVHIFSQNSNKKTVAIILFLFIIIANAMLLLINAILGSIVCVVCLVYFLMYRNMSYKKFNGITGDLAGYFLCWCETLVLICVVLFNNNY